MSNEDFDLEMNELESAEDFLDYFGIDYDPSVVHVNRLHILQRFHDYLAGVEQMPSETAQRRVVYADLLAGAYRDFVKSDALTEKVFRVFQMRGPTVATVDLSELTSQLSRAS